MRVIDVTKAPLSLIEYLSARLAGVDLEFVDATAVVAGEEEVDGEGLVFPAAWEPASKVLQLEQVVRGRRISTIAQADGTWLATAAGPAGHVHKAVASERAEAVLRCAVLAEFGPVVEISEEVWPDLCICLQASDPAVRAAGLAPEAGAYSGMALQACVFPIQAWEVVERHGGACTTPAYEVGSITVLGTDAERPDVVRCQDARGAIVRMAARDLYCSEDLAQAVANVRAYDAEQARHLAPAPAG